MLTSLLTSLSTKIIIGLVTLLVIVGLAFGVYYYHDQYEQTSAKLSQALVDNASLVKQHNDQIVALEAVQSDALKRQTETTTIKTAISKVPNSNACIGSSPIRAMLSGLQSTSNVNTK